MAHDAEEEQLNKYGKPLKYDRNIEAPLLKRRPRSCTDVPCLLIFIVFLGGWVFIASYAIKNGDLNKLMAPTDSFNQKCGIDSNVLHKKYLFFFDLEKCIDPLVPLTGCPTPQVCVESCPTETFVWDQMKDKLSFAEIKNRLICLSDADKNNIQSKQDAEKAIKANRCASKYIQSAPFLNRCMWQFSPQVCDFIPTVFLRTRRNSALNSSSALIANNLETKFRFGDTEPELQAMALTVTDPQQYVAPSATDTNAKEVVEPIIQCKRRKQLNEAVIKEKMMQTDTRLAKFVGNIVAHFYNGTHDAQRIGEEIVEDIVNSWPVVLIVLICTLVASLFFIALMRWLAGPILWISIFGVIIGLAFGIYKCIQQYIFWRDTPTVPNHSLTIHSALKNVMQEHTNWLYLTILLSVFLVVIVLLVIVLRSRISIAVALIKEGSKAVTTVTSTVFFPLFSWVLFIGAVTYAIGIGLYLGSIGEPTFRMIRQLDENSLTGVSSENCLCEGPAANYHVGDKCEPDIFQKHCYNPGTSAITGFFATLQRSACTKTSCSFVQIEHPKTVQWFIVYNVFGFLWLSFFISAFSDMVLAATFANWYWTFKKKDVPYFTLTRAFCQTIFYHLGTLAFGSLILAICRLIRLVLEYIDSKLKKYDNPVTRAILCCMKCFFWLLESFLKFLNRNAYIMCAIHGKSFCGSAKDAFNLIMRNFLRVVTLDKVTDFLFLMSKILLTGVAGVATYYYLQFHPNTIQLHYNAVPTTIVVIVGFLIASVCFAVYSMAVDTLFLCFLEDCERNDGTPEKPYYMSKNLMRILGKRNKNPTPKRSNENK